MQRSALAAATLLAGSALLAQDASAPVSPSMSPAELTAALDGWIAPQASSGTFAGVVLVAKDGRVLFERAYGTADREVGTPMSADLRFSLASIGMAMAAPRFAAARVKEPESMLIRQH